MPTIENATVTTSSDASAPVVETRDARILRLQREKDARDKVAAERETDFELAELEADSKFSSDGLVRGFDFEIVRAARAGEVIVVQRNAGILFERFSHSQMTQKQTLEFVVPCVVFPEPAVAKSIFDDFPGVANRCAIALSALYGANLKAKSGKY